MSRLASGGQIDRSRDLDVLFDGRQLVAAMLGLEGEEVDEEMIRASWEADLVDFLEIRRQYLLYLDFLPSSDLH